MRRADLLRLVCPLLIGLALAGCGQYGSGTLEGVVKYNGKPLAMGSVTVVGRDKIPKLGRIEENGHYVVTDVPCGPVKIAVSSPEPPPETVDAGPARGRKEQAARAAARQQQPPAASKKWVKIPDKYEDPEGSELATTVEKGTTKYDIELK